MKILISCSFKNVLSLMFLCALSSPESSVVVFHGFRPPARQRGGSNVLTNKYTFPLIQFCIPHIHSINSTHIPRLSSVPCENMHTNNVFCMSVRVCWLCIYITSQTHNQTHMTWDLCCSCGCGRMWLYRSIGHSSHPATLVVLGSNALKNPFISLRVYSDTLNKWKKFLHKKLWIGRLYCSDSRSAKGQKDKKGMVEVMVERSSQLPLIYV